MIKEIINNLFFKEIYVCFDSKLSDHQIIEVLNNSLKPLQEKIPHQYKEKALFGYTNNKNECYITTQTLDNRMKLYFQGLITKCEDKFQLCGTLTRINYLLMYNLALILFILCLPIFSTGQWGGTLFSIILFSTVALMNIIFSRTNYQEDFNFIITKLNLLLESNTSLIPLKPTK